MWSMDDFPISNYETEFTEYSKRELAQGKCIHALAHAALNGDQLPFHA